MPEMSRNNQPAFLTIKGTANKWARTTNEPNKQPATTKSSTEDEWNDEDPLSRILMPEKETESCKQSKQIIRILLEQV